MKKMFLILIIGFLVTVVLIALTFFIQEKWLDKIDSFSACKERGYPVQEIYPERCTLPNGKSFINPEQESIVCIQDAKECPGGTFVGRIPPNCNFAPCPEGGIRE